MYELPTFPCFYPLLTTSKSIDFTGFLTNLLSSKFLFYNYILKCFVLIDLKVGDLTHQDLGQMQMYVHYYERELMNEGDNPPIGIVLCADKSESVVKYTLPENETQIFASKYKLYLPSEEELLQELNQEYQALEAGKTREESIGGMEEK